MYVHNKLIQESNADSGISAIKVLNLKVLFLKVLFVKSSVTSRRKIQNPPIRYVNIRNP